MAIEVELRGPLQTEDYEQLKVLLAERGEFLNEERRFFVAYRDGSSGGIKDPLTDVRLRMTNGDLELIVKKGSTLQSKREEQSLFLRDNDIAGALRAMALLGYTNGIAAYRHIERYTLDGIEFALQAVHVCDGRPLPSQETLHSRFFEAELLCASGEEEATLQRLQAALESHGLHIHSYNSWDAYMDVMNTEANMEFDFQEHGEMLAAIFS